MSGYQAIYVRGVDRIEAEELCDLVHMPDVVVLQLSAEQLSEQQLTERLTLCGERFPGAAILILASAAPIDLCITALRCNVRGFLTSDHGPDPVISVIRLVADGLAVFPHSTLQPLGTQSLRSSLGQPWPSSPSMEDLTSRQQEVFALLLDGLSNKNIANRLAIAESTVKVHVRAIMQRSSARSRAQLLSQFVAGRP